LEEMAIKEDGRHREHGAQAIAFRKQTCRGSRCRDQHKRKRGSDDHRGKLPRAAAREGAVALRAEEQL